MSDKAEAAILVTVAVILLVAICVLSSGCRGWQCQPYASATFTGAKAGVQCQQSTNPNAEVQP